MKKMMKQRAVLILATALVVVGAGMTRTQIWAYTEEEKAAAKEWLSANGYSPDRSGANQAYQDYLDGKIPDPRTGKYYKKDDEKQDSADSKKEAGKNSDKGEEKKSDGTEKKNSDSTDGKKENLKIGSPESEKKVEETYRDDALIDKVVPSDENWTSDNRGEGVEEIIGNLIPGTDLPVSNLITKAGKSQEGRNARDYTVQKTFGDSLAGTEGTGNQSATGSGENRNDAEGVENRSGAGNQNGEESVTGEENQIAVGKAESGESSVTSVPDMDPKVGGETGTDKNSERQMNVVPGILVGIIIVIGAGIILWKRRAH